MLEALGTYAFIGEMLCLGVLTIPPLLVWTFHPQFRHEDVAAKVMPWVCVIGLFVILFGG